LPSGTPTKSLKKIFKNQFHLPKHQRWRNYEVGSPRKPPLETCARSGATCGWERACPLTTKNLLIKIKPKKDKMILKSCEMTLVSLVGQLREKQ
jgi:hypothetical protein